jgi:cbb3-type cytochrome oxidase cytochrome c subunit
MRRIKLIHSHGPGPRGVSMSFAVEISQPNMTKPPLEESRRPRHGVYTGTALQGIDLWEQIACMQCHTFALRSHQHSQHHYKNKKRGSSLNFDANIIT